MKDLPIKWARHRAAGTKGFTLIEMLIAVLVLSILLSIAAPSFLDLLQNNRMVSEVYRLRATLNNARSEALVRRSPVTLCRSNDGASCVGEWNEGYIAFVDVDGDGVFDAGVDELFMSVVPDNLTIDVEYSNAANRVRFDSRGNVGAFGGTFSVCDERGADFARGVIVAAVGSVRASVEDPNDIGGILLDHNGDQLACN